MIAEQAQQLPARLLLGLRRQRLLMLEVPGTWTMRLYRYPNSGCQCNVRRLATRTKRSQSPPPNSEAPGPSAALIGHSSSLLSPGFSRDGSGLLVRFDLSGSRHQAQPQCRRKELDCLLRRRSTGTAAACPRAAYGQLAAGQNAHHTIARS